MPTRTENLAADVDWAALARRLTLFALKRLGNGDVAHAEDVAQEALRRFLDPAYAAWDRAHEPDLVRHLGSIVNGIVSTERQREGRRDGKQGQVEHSRYEAREDEEQVLRRDLIGRATRMLYARLQNDELAERVLALCLEGVDKAAEQALQLGVPVAQIYSARRRLAVHQAEVKCSLSEKVWQ